jgi:hypothetical protein
MFAATIPVLRSVTWCRSAPGTLQKQTFQTVSGGFDIRDLPDRALAARMSDPKLRGQFAMAGAHALPAPGAAGVIRLHQDFCRRQFRQTVGRPRCDDIPAKQFRRG